MQCLTLPLARNPLSSANFNHVPYDYATFRNLSYTHLPHHELETVSTILVIITIFVISISISIIIVVVFITVYLPCPECELVSGPPCRSQRSCSPLHSPCRTW